MKMQAAAISHILVSNCSFIPILGPTLPPDLFACWWCPCGVTWDAYPWQLWLLKLLLKPAFHFFYLQAGACQWTTVMVTNYSWDNLQGDNTDKQLTSVSKSGLWRGTLFFLTTQLVLLPYSTLLNVVPYWPMFQHRKCAICCLNPSHFDEWLFKLGPNLVFTFRICPQNLFLPGPKGAWWPTGCLQRSCLTAALAGWLVLVS